MATFLYTRHSPKNRAYPEQLSALKAFAPEAIHLEDKVRGCTPPAERQAFQQLLTTVQTGDTVVLWWLTAFGRDFSQALSTIQTLLNKGVTLKTVCEPMTFEPDSVQTQTLLSLLSGYGQVQTQHRLFAAEPRPQSTKRRPTDVEAEIPRSPCRQSETSTHCDFASGRQYATKRRRTMRSQLIDGQTSESQIE